MHIRSLVAVALVATLSAAHGGKLASKEVVELQQFLQHSKHDLSHCVETLQARGLYARNIERRANFALGLMRKRGIEERQLSNFDKSHKSNADYTADTDASVVFAGNKSCVLAPEQIDGPYYVAGERVRQDVVEDQEGVPLAIDLQVVDTTTCEPIKGAYIDIWHANATGVYGGVAAEGNGAGPSDQSNLNNTWLRGAQESDEDGAVQFHSIFPGFYSGRTVHIHVAVHLNATMLPNGTILDTSAAHVGQMYFDQDLITEVNKVAPYKENKSTFVTNEADMLLMSLAESTADPIMEYALLGEKLEDGLIAWLGMGVNVTYLHEIIPAVTYYQDGGVPNPNAMAGPPPGQEFPGGVPPPGFPPGLPGMPPPPGMGTQP